MLRSRHRAPSRVRRAAKARLWSIRLTSSLTGRGSGSSTIQCGARSASSRIGLLMMSSNASSSSRSPFSTPTTLFLLFETNPSLLLRLCFPGSHDVAWRPHGRLVRCRLRHCHRHWAGASRAVGRPADGKRATGSSQIRHGRLLLLEIAGEGMGSSECFLESEEDG